MTKWISALCVVTVVAASLSGCMDVSDVSTASPGTGGLPLVFGPGMTLKYVTSSGSTLEFRLGDELVMRDESGIARAGFPLIGRVDGADKFVVYLDVDGTRFGRVWRAPYTIQPDGSHQADDSRAIHFFDQGALPPFLIGFAGTLYASPDPMTPLSRDEPSRIMHYARETAESGRFGDRCARLTPVDRQPLFHGRESAAFLQLDATFVVCEGIPVAVEADFTALGGPRFTLAAFNSSTQGFAITPLAMTSPHAVFRAPSQILPERGGERFDAPDPVDAFELARRESESFKTFLSRHPDAYLMMWYLSKDDAPAGGLNTENVADVLSTRIDDRLMRIAAPGSHDGYEVVFEAYERPGGERYLKIAREGAFTADAAGEMKVRNDQLTLRSGFDRAARLIGTKFHFMHVMRVAPDADEHDAFLVDRYELRYYFDGFTTGAVNLLAATYFDSKTGNLLKVSGPAQIVEKFVPILV